MIFRSLMTLPLFNYIFTFTQSPKMAELGVKIYRIKPELYELGLTEAWSPGQDAHRCKE